MSSKIPDPEVGTKDGAQFLGCGEATFRKKLDSGEIPSRLDVNGHRKTKFSDLMKHKMARERAAKEAAKERRAKMDALQKEARHAR